MCVIALAYQIHTDYPLILLSNRDEFHDRPSTGAFHWSDPPILAGHDQSAGGTWLGLHPSGRFATVTNYRAPADLSAAVYSRGHLVTDFLRGNQAPEVHLNQIEQTDYAGFNLLAGTIDDLWFSSNRHGRPRRLKPGLYGLSNGELDSNWPKVNRAKQHLKHLVETTKPTGADLYLDAFSDRYLPPDDELPDTGVGLGWERLLSSVFIQTEDYGTQYTTLVTIDCNGLATMNERRYNHRGVAQRQTTTHLQMTLNKACT